MTPEANERRMRIGDGRKDEGLRLWSKEFAEYFSVATIEEVVDGVHYTWFDNADSTWAREP